MCQRNSCILCSRDAEFEHIQETTKYRVKCNVCGIYKIADIEISSIKDMRPEDRAMISAYTRELFEREGKEPDLDELKSNYQIDIIVKRYKGKNSKDKLYNLIWYISKKSKYFGFSVRVLAEKDYPITFSPNRREFEEILEAAKKEGLIKDVPLDSQGGGNISLTWRGWRLAEELRKAVEESNKCFVAMSCSEDLREIYENGIKPAIEEAGYDPIFIEKEEHNEKICDLVIAEIRSSKFLIADVTEQKQNVYYEAGFAYGLNKDVIWMCRQDEINNLHFDTRQYNHILWENAENLRIKLINRIKATII